MNDFNSVPLEFFQDHPEPGVNFIDVGCIFDQAEHWRLAIDTLHAKTDESVSYTHLTLPTICSV